MSKGKVLHVILNPLYPLINRTRTAFVALLKPYGITVSLDEIQVLKTILPQYEIVHHARPKWLERQEFDIYIPRIKLAIEYMGEQHYKPIDFFGGKDAFEKSKERDERKRRKAEEKGVRILYIRFDEMIEVGVLKKKLSKFIEDLQNNRGLSRIELAELEYCMPREKDCPMDNTPLGCENSVVESCNHVPSDRESRVVGLYRLFPSQGGVGFRHRCINCGCWLVCECEREFYLTYLPNYLDRFEEIGENIAVSSNVCRACRCNDKNAREYFERFRRAIEYIVHNDKDFFNYCYGSPNSGYEKDMMKCAELRHSASPSKSLEKQVAGAKMRQKKARKLINSYIFSQSI